jgi:hypothetical protein
VFSPYEERHSMTKDAKNNRRARRLPPVPGDRVGRLVVSGRPYRRDDGQTMVPADCDCGESTALVFRNWGQTKSCGCLQKERASETFTKHGQGTSRLYKVWTGLKQRCENPRKNSYANYGARGIYVCDEWQDFEVFAAWADENGYDGKLDIDRIDNDGPYSPENCHWVTRSENLRNTRRSRKLTALGETQTMIAWSEDERCQVSYAALEKRLRMDWDPEDAILTPKGRWNPKRKVSS